MEKYGRAKQANDENTLVCWSHRILILNSCQRQQWLCEGASMLRYTYTACLVYLSLRLFLTHTFIQIAYIHLARILQPQQFWL